MSERQAAKTLGQKVVLGGFWVFALRLSSRLLSLISTLVLARILAPADFGLFGIAMLAISSFETFSQLGFSTALIQKETDISQYLDTAWTFQFLRGLFLTVIIVVAGPLFAKFFNTPEAKQVIQVLSLSMLIQGLNNIGIIFFEKELEFHKQYLYQLSSSLTNVIVSIVLVVLLKSIWALVFGILAGDFVRLILSYLIHPFRPRLRFNILKAKDLFHFGKWVLASHIVIYLIIQVDNIVIGKFLGVTALGFYQMAFRISSLPTTEVTHVISQVTFPAYSKLQTDNIKLQEAYLNVLKLTSSLSFTMGALIIIFCHDFIIIFLGSKWLPIVPAIKILCIFGILRSLNATTGPIFYATGKPSLLTTVSTVQLIFLLILIYPFVMSWSFIGASWAVTICNFICFLTAFYFLSKIIKLTMKKIILSIYLPFLINLAIILIILVLNDLFLIQLNIYARIAYSLALFIIFFTLFNILFNKSFINIILYKLLIKKTNEAM